MVHQVSHDLQEHVTCSVFLAAGSHVDGGPFIFKLPLFLLNWLQPILSNGFKERAYHAETLKEDTQHSRDVLAYALQSSESNSMFVVKAFYNQWLWTKQEVIAKVSTPMLYLSGAGDKILTPSNASNLVNMNPDVSEFEVISKTGHQLMEERPEEVNKAMEAFIMKHV